MYGPSDIIKRVELKLVVEEEEEDVEEERIDSWSDSGGNRGVLDW